MRHMCLSRMAVAAAALFLAQTWIDECRADPFGGVKWMKKPKRTSTQRVDPKKTTAPCEWAENLEAAKAAASVSRPIYMYFSENLTQTSLPTQYRNDVEMQKISQEKAVFVLMWVPEEPTPQDKEMLAKYGVSGSGRAVIADPHGNPLVKYAETRSAKRLLKQLEKACEDIKKAEDEADKRYQQAEKALEKGNRRVAVAHLEWVINNLSGTPEAEGAADKMAKIDKDVEKEFRAIIDGDDEPNAKRIKLGKLQAMTPRTLPIYNRIAEAVKRLK